MTGGQPSSLSLTRRPIMASRHRSGRLRRPPARLPRRGRRFTRGKSSSRDPPARDRNEITSMQWLVGSALTEASSSPRSIVGLSAFFLSHDRRERTAGTSSHGRAPAWA